MAISGIALGLMPLAMTNQHSLLLLSSSALSCYCEMLSVDWADHYGGQEP